MLLALVATTSFGAEAKTQAWLCSSLHRIFPHTAPADSKRELLAAQNARVAYQACIRNDEDKAITVNCKVSGADDLKPLVRFVGLGPFPRWTTATSLSETGGVYQIPGLALG